MRSDRLRLQDAIGAAEVIARYLPKDRASFDADPPLQSHVYRHLTILCEAVWKLSRSLKDARPDVSWKQIEGMRHILVHDYFRVNWDVVYTAASEHVPAFKPILISMLIALPPTEQDDDGDDPDLPVVTPPRSPRP